MKGASKGIVFAIDETASHDGPGLRMNIYLKGCPLKCAWCHSPESVSPEPEIVWYSAKCKKCGECGKVCAEGIISFGRIDPKFRDKCADCLKCAKACANKALEIKGREMCAEEIAVYAATLLPFFKKTNGGITITGGEPTLQPELTFDILDLCKAKGIHTAVETSGFVKWDVLERIAGKTDLFLYDIKHPDDALHKKYTGVSNKIILENLSKLVRSGADVVVRVPLIPGYNDSPETVRATADIIRKAGASKVSLLPFNPASAGKYSWLNLAYPLSGIKPQSPEYIKDLESIVSNVGLQPVRYG